MPEDTHMSQRQRQRGENNHNQRRHYKCLHVFRSVCVCVAPTSVSCFNVYVLRLAASVCQPNVVRVLLPSCSLWIFELM